jgi:HD-like signal output (HDOD) protein
VDPQTFQLRLADAATVVPGAGFVAAFVPAAADYPPVVAIGSDPRNDPGVAIQDAAPALLNHLYNQLDRQPGIRWALLDNWGRFFDAVPKWAGAPGDGLPEVEFQRFPQGLGVEGFLKQLGGAAEAALEMLSSVVEAAAPVAVTPPMREFLETIEAHGNLPAPGALFQKVETAALTGDVKAAAAAIQLDPVISATLINYGNAANFATARKTASVPEVVQRLGMAFVRRVVFVAEMMARYRKGACPAFDYRGYWRNAVATGAAMRGLMERFDLPERQGDEAFTTGLVSGIGWLALAETFPLLVSQYLERAGAADPVTKARVQLELFPCPIRRVSEMFLSRYAFPETVKAAVAGTGVDHRAWYDCLAAAVRVAQALAPFDCLAVPSTAPVPDACAAEWQRWQGLVPA